MIMNLTEMVDSDAKRLVDFAAGLIFGLHGSIERVTNKVFLLSPANVEVDRGGQGTDRGTGLLQPELAASSRQRREHDIVRRAPRRHRACGL